MAKPNQTRVLRCSVSRGQLRAARPGSPGELCGGGDGPASGGDGEGPQGWRPSDPATTSTRAVRFPRTIAVYSPMASRRLTAFLEEPSTELERRPWEKPPEGGAEPLGQRPAEPLGQRPAAPPEPAAEASQEEAAEAAEAEPAEPPAPPAQPAEPLAQPQFLEQKYGYYHCKACNIRWESAYVWCVQGTNKVYFRQFCRTCQKSYNPYRVEDITCQSCKQTRCTCPVKMRHVDPKRPHRQDLCGRCKGKRLSCDSTFSFKYII
uniref:Zygote arrest 1 n=1 Tax=Malurus cyaneus samueli TaxID=2593467 RepID=A0A8C5T136_9PASS